MQYGPTGDPTRGQGRVLAILKLQEEITTKDLSYMLGIRQQSLNELLNKLESGGYVIRIPSEADKRVMLVKLTEKGRNEDKKDDPDFDSIFNCLNEEEQAAFGAYLDRIISAFESQLGIEADDNVRAEWLRAARSRMGDEQFERLMSMRRGPFNPRFRDI
jgi:DNA-binding MarR family transcriptional regulator